MLLAGRWNSAEEFEYLTVARNLIDGKGMTYHLLGTGYHALLFPVFPLLRALILIVFGAAVWPIQLLLIAFNAGSACLACMLASRITPNRHAHLLATALTALHPGLLFYAIGKVHWLPIGVFASIGLLLLADRIIGSPGNKIAWIFGLCLGVSFLLRPNLVLIGPAAFAAVLVFGGARRKGYLRVFLIAGFCAALAASPWWVRNRIVLGQWVPGISATGLQFWKGNHPGATGTNYRKDGESILRDVPLDVRGRGELEQNEILKREAMDYIVHDPAGFLTRTARKLYYFVWFTPDAGQTYQSWQTRGYQAYYVFVLLGVLAFIIGRPELQQRRKMLLTTMILYFSATGLIHALCYVENRHRWITEGVLLCVAAAGYAGLLERIRPRKAAPEDEQLTA